jgi:hypothetical protein
VIRVVAFVVARVLAVGLAIGLAACARVRPHERETLAHRALAQPPVTAQHAAHQHVFEIREGTAGAAGAGGGGCGCN